MMEWWNNGQKNDLQADLYLINDPYQKRFHPSEPIFATFQNSIIPGNFSLA